MRDPEDVFDEKVWALLSKQSLSREELEGAVHILYEHFILKIMGVLVKAGSDEISAEDITKEAIERAIKSYKKGKAKFVTYTTKIALNILFEKYRKGLLPPRRTKQIEEETTTPANIAHSDVYEVEDDPVEKSEFIKKVETVFHLLPREDQVLINFDINGVPKESYMGLYGVSDALYRQRKLRAYNKLRSLLSEQ